MVFPVDCLWPPPCGPDGILSEAEARRYIATGTPNFRGVVRPIRCAPAGNFYFYAYATKSGEAEWEDCAPSMNEFDAFEDMSSALSPQDSIEKPAMSGSHGLYPGTVTISYYTASHSSSMQVVEAPPYKVKLRKVTMLYLLEQLTYLQRQGGFDDMVCTYSSRAAMNMVLTLSRIRECSTRIFTMGFFTKTLTPTLE